MDLNFIIFPNPSPTYTHEDMFGQLLYIPHDCYQWSLTNPFISSKRIDEIYNHGKELAVHGSYRGKCIPCLYKPCYEPSSKILLYFHGNAEDIALTDYLMTTLQIELKAHIIVMEYEGYGIYKGSTKAESIIKDCELLFYYVTNVLKYSPSNIIAFGRSIGSGPASYLASKYKLHSLILMSAFTSLRAVAKGFVGPLFQYAMAERFDNKNLMQNVICPVFIIHGRKDDIVSCSQAEELLSELQKVKVDAFLYIPENMDHNSFDFENDFVMPLMEFYINRGYTSVPKEGESGVIILPIKALNKPIRS